MSPNSYLKMQYIIKEVSFVKELHVLRALRRVNKSDNLISRLFKSHVTLKSNL